MSYCDSCGTNIGSECHSCASQLCEDCVQSCDSCDESFCEDCLKDGLCQDCRKKPGAENKDGRPADACKICDKSAVYDNVGTYSVCTRCRDTVCADHLTFTPYGRCCPDCIQEHVEVFGS